MSPARVEILRGCEDLVRTVSRGVLIAEPTPSSGANNKTYRSCEHRSEDSDDCSSTYCLAYHGGPTLRIAAHGVTFHLYACNATRVRAVRQQRGCAFLQLTQVGRWHNRSPPVVFASPGIVGDLVHYHDYSARGCRSLREGSFQRGVNLALVSLSV